MMLAEASPPTSPSRGGLAALPELRAEKVRTAGGLGMAAGSLLVSARGRPCVDQLMGDLAASRLGQHAAEVQAVAADDESERMAGQVIHLEADRRALRVEVERLRRKSFELEKANTTLAQLLEEAQLNLKEALGRERLLGRSSVERQLAAAEAENKTLVARNEADGVRVGIRGLERALAAKDAEAESLVEELRAARARRGESDSAEARLQMEVRQLSGSRTADKEAKEGAEARAAAFEARLWHCQEALHAAAAREAALSAEVDLQKTGRLRMEAINRRLRLDMQEVMAQAVRGGERPYYFGSNSPAIDPVGCFNSFAAAGSMPLGAGGGGGHGGSGGTEPRLPSSPSSRQKDRRLVPGMQETLSATSPRCRPPSGPAGVAAAPPWGCSILDTREQALDRIDRLFQAPAAG